MPSHWSQQLMAILNNIGNLTKNLHHYVLLSTKINVVYYSFTGSDRISSGNVCTPIYSSRIKHLQIKFKFHHKIGTPFLSILLIFSYPSLGFTLTLGRTIPDRTFPVTVGAVLFGALPHGRPRS